MKLEQLPTEFADAVLAGFQKGELDQTRPILIAFSGGQDSTALLLACKALSFSKGLRIIAAHFNHRLRPKEDPRESAHAQTICGSLSVKLVKGDGDTRGYAGLNGISLEQAARELRYRFFASAAEEMGAQGVATGHTLDDQAETVLLNLIRGTGIHGLKAMRSKMRRKASGETPPLDVIRPLLEVRREDCEAVCKAAEVGFISDSSNFNKKFIRNRIRHEIIPVMKEINLQTVTNIAKLAKIADSTLDAIGHALGEAAAKTDAYGASVLDRKALQSLKSDSLRLFALRDALDKTKNNSPDITQSHLRAMKEFAETGKVGCLDLPGNLEFIATYQHFVIADKSWRKHSGAYPPSPLPEVRMNWNGSTKLSDGFQILASTLTPTENVPIGDSASDIAHLDAEICSGDLTVRKRREGDRFMPLGMKTEMKLQDFFTNAKVPVWLRDRVPIVEGVNGILWVAGLRISDWAKVTSATEQILRLKFLRPGLKVLESSVSGALPESPDQKTGA